jgi:hypothetical protein
MAKIPKGRPPIKTVAKPATRDGSSIFGPVAKGGKGK